MLVINGCLQNTQGSEKLNGLYNRSAALGFEINLGIEYQNYCAGL